MKTRKLTTALIVAAGLFTANAQAEDKEIKKGDVPQAVLDAFAIAKPKAKVTEYELKTRDGQSFYEIEYKENGLEHEYYYAADGTLLETSEEILTYKLPTDILKSVKAAYPNAKIKEVKKKLMADGNPSGYEIELKEKGKEIELDIDASGKIVKVELGD
jgi:uncharacterized membrane protein YkoI